MCKMNRKCTRPLLATASFKSASGMLHGRETALTFSIHFVAVHHQQHGAIRRVQNTSQSSRPLSESRMQGSVAARFPSASSAIVASCCCPCRHYCHHFYVYYDSADSISDCSFSNENASASLFSATPAGVCLVPSNQLQSCLSVRGLLGGAHSYSTCTTSMSTYPLQNAV